MKTSIATVSISGDLAEKLEAIAAAGFDGVEIFENDLLTFNGSPREVRRMVADLGLEITLFQPFRDFEGLPEPHRARAFERAERKFDLMQEMGAELMLVCSSVSPLALGGIDRCAADFRELGERAQRRGLRVGYEALAWGRHISDHRDAWEIVRRADHPNVGLILDSFHTLSRGIDPDGIRSIPGDRIFFVQLADAPRIDMDVLQWSRHYRNMPGQGDLPVADFLRAVLAAGYSGPLSLEVFNDQFRGGGSPKAIAVDGRRALTYLFDQAARAEPALGLDASAMPPRVAVEGVAFVEFATSEQEGAKLASQLTSIGFARVARHHHKRVALYRQGDINIVLNTEREGLAHSAYVTHGTTAYAIGLKVEDAQAAIQRAAAMGAAIHEQPVARGDLNIPAIRGVGGGVIYFIDAHSDLGRVWDIEFVPEARADHADIGLIGMDHIAQTMAHDEMLTWVLFYGSIFATRKSPMVDVLDPSGIVRSQVIENETGTLRLTLNGAENSRTFAGHFINEAFGASVQHMAFATNDIIKTAAALRSNGFEALQISLNYYDDLAARFGLEDDVIERLRANHLLYDRDDGGEFFQLYSRTFGEGLFFEIVERRGAYGGYGAPNAPFRIAAQRRTMRPAAIPRL
ncbi:bifunctional sugar phosphate isomerase/epimerase/4-hydroxyphenylpyruvate dioxygenase family protein [Devosia sp. CN2-171]|uniref:bifunctional sugar phosphate isomerase/epimerase/4-hydroxyphenylpyruvate dioxygenase family protein n=1 Tax=Devosia sp. CN2-171 TaxID=3400909 RepID=UPI003BF77EDA